MKELEQEKDSLLAGLEVVERARDWYQGQIHNVTERQRQVGQNSHCTVSSSSLSKELRYKVLEMRPVVFCCLMIFSFIDIDRRTNVENILAYEDISNGYI